MSDTSDSNSGSRTSSNKRRISQLDDHIEQLTQEVNSLNKFLYKTELECTLMSVRLKREKLKALAAIAKSQVLMANMQILVAEGELYTDIEKLKNFKKQRLDSEAGASQRDLHQASTPLSTSTVSVETTKGTSDKKKHRKHSSSKKTPVENTSSRKSPVQTSLDQTVLIPSICESTTSLVESAETSLTSFSQLFDITPVSRSGSEISLSSSVKAEFNDPFTQSQSIGIVQKSPTNKPKSDKKETKYKSKSQSHKEASVSVVKQTQSQQTVAELRKSVDTASKNTESIPCTIFTPKSTPAEKKSPASATYMPARHTNLPQLVPQPSTSAKSSAIYLNPATQTNTQYNSQPQDPRLNCVIPFYSGKQ